MSDSKKIFSLYEEDCVGNDVGKHNFNSLYLESTIANLSSRFFGPDINITPALSSYATKSWTEILSGFLTRAPILSQFTFVQKVNTAYTAVSLLSSYWSSPEFSITYPVNINYENSSSSWWQQIRSPHKKSPMLQLIRLAKSYLDVYFPPENYLKGTRIHVNMYLYSYHSSPAFRDLDNLISVRTRAGRTLEALQPSLTIDPNEAPITEYDYNNRHLEVQMLRRDVHFDHGLVISFLQGGSSWVNINLFGQSFDPTDPTRTSVTLEIKSNVYNYDVGEAVKVVKAADTNTNNPQNNYQSFDLSSDLEYIQGYVPGKTDIIIIVHENVEVSSYSADIPAMFIGNLASGDTVTLFNYGSIIGAGGDGGNGGDSPGGTSSVLGKNGKQGGTAISVYMPAIIENKGKIYGGGGGGAGGDGGTTGANSVGGGGGGGAGKTPGASGYRGTNELFLRRNLNRNSIYLRDGSPGKKFTPGDGGPGITGTSLASYKSSGAPGGSIGQPGQNSYSALGGNAGFYVVGDSNVFWSVRGDVAGNLV